MQFGSVLYEGLVNATGSGALGDVILSAADSEIGVDEIFGYWFEDGNNPLRIASAGRIGSPTMRASLYIGHYHSIDPLAWLATAAKEGEPTRSGRIAATDITDPTYRRECYDMPGFFEKLSFARRRGSRHYVLNFYRRRNRQPAGVGALGELAEIVFPLLRKQVEMCGHDLDLPLIDRVEQRLLTSYPLLTGREREVCARTLIGKTAEAISIDLGVSEATVLTYRRRAYERYRISTAHEMIQKILF